MEYLSQLSIPPENLRAYKILYSMENAIRMLIVECLEELAGTRWYRHRLPGDILDSYQKAQIEVRKIKWTSLVPHHPIYYIDFPALRKIIEQKKTGMKHSNPYLTEKMYFLLLGHLLSRFEITLHTIDASVMQILFPSPPHLRF